MRGEGRGRVVSGLLSTLPVLMRQRWRGPGAAGPRHSGLAPRAHGLLASLLAGCPALSRRSRHRHRCLMRGRRDVVGSQALPA